MIKLDNKQLRAVKAPSPTLVNAAAGSGKTRCLIAKIISLIEQGVDPKSICAITFTNKAANEMKERLKSQCSLPTTDIQVSTIHSLCVRIIRTFIQHTYLKLPFSIYDEGDQASVIKTIIKQVNLCRSSDDKGVWIDADDQDLVVEVAWAGPLAAILFVEEVNIEGAIRADDRV